ncbi:hypothetical protein O9993_08025 [Vibrio lentus]|nr:hypothetical protein [Vibrio lentus]
MQKAIERQSQAPEIIDTSVIEFVVIYALGISGIKALSIGLRRYLFVSMRFVLVVSAQVIQYWIPHVSNKSRPWYQPSIESSLATALYCRCFGELRLGWCDALHWPFTTSSLEP